MRLPRLPNLAGQGFHDLARDARVPAALCVLQMFAICEHMSLQLLLLSTQRMNGMQSFMWKSMENLSINRNRCTDAPGASYSARFCMCVCTTCLCEGPISTHRAPQKLSTPPLCRKFRAEAESNEKLQKDAFACVLHDLPLSGPDLGAQNAPEAFDTTIVQENPRRR